MWVLQTARWLSLAIMPLLQSSAQAAVTTCTAGTDGNQCGLRWTEGPINDGMMGVGEQMSVLEIVQSNLIDKSWDSIRGLNSRFNVSPRVAG